MMSMQRQATKRYGSGYEFHRMLCSFLYSAQLSFRWQKASKSAGGQEGVVVFLESDGRVGPLPVAPVVVMSGEDEGRRRGSCINRCSDSNSWRARGSRKIGTGAPHLAAEQDVAGDQTPFAQVAKMTRASGRASPGGDRQFTQGDHLAVDHRLGGRDLVLFSGVNSRAGQRLKLGGPGGVVGMAVSDQDPFDGQALGFGNSMKSFGFKPRVHARPPFPIRDRQSDSRNSGPPPDGSAKSGCGPLNGRES